jgi:hypothetical protein
MLYSAGSRTQQGRITRSSACTQNTGMIACTCQAEPPEPGSLLLDATHSTRFGENNVVEVFRTAYLIRTTKIVRFGEITADSSIVQEFPKK